VLIVVVSLMLSILYYGAPNVRQPGFRWVTPGGLIAVVAWIIASAAFAFCVANFGSYNKTYGTLGGVIAFVTWLWITNLAVLFGAELNAELERGRQIEQGLHPDREPFVEPRDTKKMDDEEAALFQRDGKGNAVPPRTR
jgi:membrane protein